MAKDKNKAVGENHGRSKITQKQAEEIRKSYKGRGKGPTQRILADLFGVSKDTVNQIVNGKRWKAEDAEKNKKKGKNGKTR